MTTYKKIIISLLIIGGLQVTVMPLASYSVADTAAMSMTSDHNTRMCVALGECK